MPALFREFSAKDSCRSLAITMVWIVTIQTRCLTAFVTDLGGEFGFPLLSYFSRYQDHFFSPSAATSLHYTQHKSRYQTHFGIFVCKARHFTERYTEERQVTRNEVVRSSLMYVNHRNVSPMVMVLRKMFGPEKLRRDPDSSFLSDGVHCQTQRQRGYRAVACVGLCASDVVGAGQNVIILLRSTGREGRRQRGH